MNDFKLSSLLQSMHMHQMHYSWYFRQSLVPFTSEICSHEFHQPQRLFRMLTLSFCASCSHYLNLVQTCWVNTFHIELICLLVTSSSSVNGPCYELWKSRKKSPFTTIWWVVGCHHYELLIMKQCFCDVILVKLCKNTCGMYFLSCLASTENLGVLRETDWRKLTQVSSVISN